MVILLQQPEWTKAEKKVNERSFGHVECQMPVGQDIMVEMLCRLLEIKFGAQEKSAIEDLDLGLVNTEVDELTRIQRKKIR